MRTSWERLATDFHLLEHAEKARFAHATHADFPRGAEILGSYVVGTVSVQPKVDARRQEAEKVMGRIKFLPEDLYARLQDVKLFANSKVNYGLVASFPTSVDFKSYDALLWKAGARTGYAVKQLRSVLLGATTQWEATSAWRTLSLAKRVREEAAALGLQGSRTTNLEAEVIRRMLDLQWATHDPATGLWHHEALGVVNVHELNSKHWHLLRESWRRKQYYEIRPTRRHEFRDEIIPEYNERLISKVRKEAQDCGTRGFLLATGAMMSDAAKHKSNGGKDYTCKRCGALNHDWEAKVRCLGLDLNGDVFYRRFGMGRE